MGMGNATFSVKISGPEKYFVGFDSSTFHKGPRHCCYKGRFYDYRNYGPLHEKKCVVKVRRDRPEMDKAYWKSHIDRSSEARKVAAEWKKEAFVRTVNFLVLACVEIDETSALLGRLSRSRPVKEYEWALVSRRIAHPEQLNLNNCGSHGELSAFSHFSWSATKGDMVICDFNGRATDSDYDLLTPVIHSRDGRFGPNDEGQSGIDRFFYNHVCNNVCKLFEHPGSNASFLISQAPVRVQSGDEYLASSVLGMKPISIDKS